MDKQERVIVVTGSNKGIGYELIKKLLQTEQRSTIIMGCRSIERGEEAIKKLEEEQYNKNQNKLLVLQLDLMDNESINRFVEQIKKQYMYIYMLINNAGIAYFRNNFLNEEIARVTLQTNFYGTITLTEQMVPLIQDNGKIINISSSLGKLNRIKDQQLLVNNIQNSTNLEKIQEIANIYYQDVTNNVFSDKKFSRSVYAFSKTLLTLYSNILGNSINVLEKNIQVYACCPGWCKTDLAPNAKNTPEDGAQKIMFLVNLTNSINTEIQGQFFSENKVTII